MKFKKFTFDHEAIIERLFGIEYETLPKTLVLTYQLRTLRSSLYSIVPSSLCGKLHFLNAYFKWKFKNFRLDDEAVLNVYSASNLEFSRDFRCSRTNYVRCATQSLASFNLLGPEA